MSEVAGTSLLSPGEHFGRYRIETLVADGRTGPLYRATLSSVARPVALKLIVPDVADVPGYRERFLRSWRIAGSLDHPSVIPIHDAGDHEGHLFLASRYVDGVDLATLVRREGHLEASRAARLIAKVAGALDAAHSHGLVHSGLTAGDLILSRPGAEDEHVYVTGFHSDVRDGDGRADVRALARVMDTALGSASADASHAAADGNRGEAALRAVLARALSSQAGDGYESGRALAAAATAAAPTARRHHDATPRGDRSARRRRSMAIAALAALAIAGVGGFLLAADDSPLPGPAPAGSVVGPPIRTGDGAYGVAVGGGLLWVTNAIDGTVARIDLDTRRPVGRPVRVGARPHAIAFAEDGVWVVNNDDDTVVRLDPRSGRRIGRPIPVGDEPEAIVLGAGSAWTLNLDGTVTRIDPRTMRPAATIVVGPRTIGGGLAFAGGRLWVTEASEDTLSAIDPASNRVVGRPLRVGDEPWGVTSDGDVVWVVNANDRTLVRVDARTGRMRGGPVALGGSPLVVAAVADAVWVAGDEGITRIDPRRARASGRSLLGVENANSIAAGAGGVFIPDYDDGTVSLVVPDAGSGG